MHAQTSSQQPTLRPSTVHNIRLDQRIEPERSRELRASQVESVAAEEIEWFFTTTDNNGSASQARAVIESWISQLEPADQDTLALRFDTAPWPESMRAAGFERGYALAARLVSTSPRHSRRRPHQANDRRAMSHLEDAIHRHGISVTRGIVRRAEWDFAAAIRAYAKTRGRVPSVLPQHAA